MRPAIAGIPERDLTDELVDALTCLLVVVDLADTPTGLDDDLYRDARRKARAVLRRVAAEREAGR
jgi:hypothetical protein